MSTRFRSTISCVIPDVPDVIDYLSIDTEGSELDILEGCDLATFTISGA
jgi:hypothetical protein